MFTNLIDMPVAVMFGEGKLGELGTQAAKYGKKAFLLYDPFLKGSKMIETVIADLNTNGLAVVEFNDVSPNPRDTVIDQAADLCVKEDSDVVVAIGGGSAIDSAKAVAVIAKNGGKCWEYTTRKDEYVAVPEKGKLPLIVVPTTSGTGTETTAFAVINNPEKHFKATICHEALYADVAIVDPIIMSTMPPRITALTGIDAFAHAFESYTNRAATPFSEVIALASIKLFAENIREAVRDGSNLKARAGMALCSTLGGMAITHVPTSLPHGMGQPLSGLTDAPHGGSIAVCISQIIRWTLPYGQEKYAKVAEIMDPSVAGLSEEEKAYKLADILKDLFEEILGTKLTMSDYGLKEDQVETMADMIMTCYFLDCEGNPRVPTRDDLIALIRECM